MDGGNLKYWWNITILIVLWLARCCIWTFLIGPRLLEILSGDIKIFLFSICVFRNGINVIKFESVCHIMNRFTIKFIITDKDIINNHLETYVRVSEVNTVESHQVQDPARSSAVQSRPVNKTSEWILAQNSSGQHLWTCD